MNLTDRQKTLRKILGNEILDLEGVEDVYYNMVSEKVLLNIVDFSMFEQNDYIISPVFQHQSGTWTLQVYKQKGSEWIKVYDGYHEGQVFNTRKDAESFASNTIKNYMF